MSPMRAPRERSRSRDVPRAPASPERPTTQHRISHHDTLIPIEGSRQWEVLQNDPDWTAPVSDAPLDPADVRRWNRYIASTVAVTGVCLMETVAFQREICLALRELRTSIRDLSTRVDALERLMGSQDRMVRGQENRRTPPAGAATEHITIDSHDVYPPIVWDKQESDWAEPQMCQCVECVKRGDMVFHSPYWLCRRCRCAVCRTCRWNHHCLSEQTASS